MRTTLSSRFQSYKDLGEVLLRRRAPRVLVVDDNLDTMVLMRELLSSRGYDVVAVPDAAQAEAEIRRQPPDLILSDVIMPGKSGYEFCRELKGNPATRLIPFVLITGLSDREDKLHGIEAGADDFLNKPIFAEELFARVKSLVKLKEFTDELETAESVLCTLGLSVESRDPYTEGHCERLAQNASSLGHHLGLEEDSIVALRRGRIFSAQSVPANFQHLTTGRVGGDEAAPPHRREHLPTAQIATPGASHHSQSSRALRWQRLPRWSAEGRDSPAAANLASCRRLRRLAHRAPLQTCIRP
ncbi:MAG: hypothetical protein AUH86_04985 [Acidobacteria bacterium 13_1_40CM_4_58_4]|nr:MAG: hypothetical protein AUH86_04985 [Acidobacteria bacterium 13_1_40CM_4_58_4]